MSKKNQLLEIHHSGRPYIIYKSKKGFNLYTNFSKKIILNNKNIKSFLTKKNKNKSKNTDLFIGFFGALIIVGVWGGIGENPWWAMLALLGATMCYGISYPYTKKYILPYNIKPEVMATTQLLFSTLTLLPLFIFFGVKNSPDSLSQIGAALCVGFICSGIAYVWNFRIQEAVGSLITSTTMYVVPIVSTILGITLLGESLTWNEPIGCAIVLLGAAISQGRIKVR